MPSLLRGGYAPPGVYTQTFFGSAPGSVPVPNRIPVFVGTGVEILSRSNLPVVRGSSSTIDQQIVDEDQAGRAVVSVAPSGAVTLGTFDGTIQKFQVRNFPIVSGDGTGTPATDTSSVTCRVNGFPIVVLGLDAAKGIVEISVAPQAGDTVVCTYYFDRTDTLITDNVSDQVTTTSATIDGARGQNFSFVAGTTDVFSVSVDGLPFVNITMPSSAPSVSAAVVAATISGASGIGSLVASTFIDNLGQTRIRLTADKSVSIGTGTANTALGFVPNATTSRNRVFYTFNGPIVDGEGGGLTTTDPADVTVLVNGVQVIPSAVDGSTRAVTLPFAPAPGSTVTIRYYFNTWQDTFDYLANVGVTEITRAAVTPDSNGAGVFVQGESYVLKNDTIVWGTAALVSSGVHTEGGVTFGTSQVSAMLVDNRAYLAGCAATVNNSGPVSVASTTVFQLPYQPTTGNGRGNPLSTSLYNTVSNGRMDLPTTRPDLVIAYWGFGVLDALERGPVTVLKVDPDLSQITLASPIPEGASVYATFYYNTLVDAAFLGSATGYTLTSAVAGAGGIGTYTISSPSGANLYGASLTGKGSDLTTVQIVFPSGSEFTPDSRIEGGAPVEEVVTVQFESSDETPARFTAPGPGPYYPVENVSDRFRITFSNSDQQTGLAAGIDLSAPTFGARGGAFASYVGAEVEYTAASGQTTYDLTASVDDEINLVVDGVSISASTGTVLGADATTFESALNSAAVAGGNEPYYASAGAFPSGFEAIAGEYDQLRLHYTGDVSGPSGAVVYTIPVAVYASAGALAAAIDALGLTPGGSAVNCSATADGNLRFTLTSLAGGDAAGYIEFITNAVPAQDFAIIAGISTDVATNDDQVKLYNGPVARVVGTATTAGRRPYDRIVLRNRLFPGAGSMSFHSSVTQTLLQLQGGSGQAKSGLIIGNTGEATYGANVKGASVLALTGWSEGQYPTGAPGLSGQPLVTFYDGTGTVAANNYFVFEANSVLVPVTLSASAGGTATALGPASNPASAIGQILAAVGATTANVSVFQEGAGIRLVCDDLAPSATLTVGAGSANGILGFSEGDTSVPSGVTAKQLASALMNHAAANVNFASVTMNGYQSPNSAYFAGRALASVEFDSTGNEYLYLECGTQGVSAYGVASSILFKTPVADDVLVTGTLLLIKAGDGSSGEAAINGFFVISTDPTNGSGSADTSVLNSGVGQDGFVGQTYRDAVTGLTFTILPRAGAVPYPTGSNSTLTFRVSKTFTTDGNIPTLAIPGVELTVTNTAGIVSGDSALVETFKKTGDEPDIGEVYYVSYRYRKLDYTPRLYSRLSDVTAEYGAVSPDNPLSLAAYFAFLNGASVVGTYQVLKQSGSSQASEQAYLNALVALEGASLPGNLNPTVLCLLTPATQNLAKATAIHCDIQSSIRYRAERTAIFGFASGTQPLQAGAIATATGSTRVRFVYPDIATITLTDFLNQQKDYLVDGRYIAAAVTAATTSMSVDPATPWTGRLLSGFTALQRRLDAVQANQVASRGVTVIEDRLPFLRVRHGLTSDMTNVLTKTPTVIQIADEMQRRCRLVLDPYIGIKFLPQVIGQIEGQLSEMFKRAIAEQLITSFTGINVAVDPEDPTAILVEAYYVPVFPLLYIQITLRVSAQSQV